MKGSVMSEISTGHLLSTQDSRIILVEISSLTSCNFCRTSTSFSLMSRNIFRTSTPISRFLKLQRRQTNTTNNSCNLKSNKNNQSKKQLEPKKKKNFQNSGWLLKKKIAWELSKVDCYKENKLKISIAIYKERIRSNKKTS